MNKSDTTWNLSFNMPCKFLKGILVLLKWNSCTHETRASSTTLTYKKSQLQSKASPISNMPKECSLEQYDEICKYFTKESQKDNNANEVQKHLKLHDLSIGNT